jgi:hypothetical protein
LAWRAISSLRTRLVRPGSASAAPRFASLLAQQAVRQEGVNAGVVLFASTRRPLLCKLVEPA